MVVIDPSLPWRHGVEHRDDLAAADLADDHPVRGHPQRPPHQLGERDLPFALHVLLPGLHRDHVRVGAGVPVQAQLKAVLDRDQPLARRDRRGQRPQQRRLADRGAAADQDVLTGADHGGQERGELLVQGAVGGQASQGGAGEAVTADRHARPAGHGHHREQPPAARQRHADPGGGPVEPAFLVPGPGGDGADQVGQLGVAARDGRGADPPAPGVLDEHLIAAVGVDRFDVGVIQEWLEAAQAEDRVEDRLPDLPLGAGIQRRAGVGQRPGGLGIQRLGDEAPAELGAPRRGQRLRAVWPGSGFPGQAAGDVAAQPLGQLMVVPGAGLRLRSGYRVVSPAVTSAG